MTRLPRRKTVPRRPPAAAEPLVPLRRVPGIAGPQRTELRRIRPSEVEQALALILADDADSTQPIEQRVQQFKQLAIRQRYDLTKQIIVSHCEQLVYACLYVPNPGRTAFVFAAAPPKTAPASPELSALSVKALQSLASWAFRQNCNLLQLLLEPDDSARKDLCLMADFKWLTDLIYMVGPAKSTTPDVSTPPNVDWVTYAPERHEMFKSTIAASYIDSLDCPELESLRDIEDVILGHKAAGIFAPDCWKVLLQNGRPIGVLILSPLKSSDAIELTYMGLTPAARGHGLGAFMLAEALRCVHRHSSACLMLAVDCRNRAAFDLYQRFGLSSATRRSVLYRSTAL